MALQSLHEGRARFWQPIDGFSKPKKVSKLKNLSIRHWKRANSVDDNNHDILKHFLGDFLNFSSFYFSKNFMQSWKLEFCIENVFKAIWSLEPFENEVSWSYCLTNLLEISHERPRRPTASFGNKKVLKKGFQKGQ